MEHAKLVFQQQWETNFHLLEKEVENCSDYELYPLFEKYIKKGDKILENGCGMGRWVIYYNRLGYDITGIDWSNEIVEKVKSLYPDVHIKVGDSRETNFNDETFDIILSLGTFEHSEEGPEKAIKESIRILKKGGILICTMPNYSLLLKVKTFFKEFYRKIKYRGVKYKIYREYQEKLIKVRSEIFPSVMISGLDKPEFFEYYFSHKAFLQYFNLPNVKILENFTAFGKDGLFFIFKNLIGKWDYSKSKVNLNLLGKILYYLLPNKLYNLHNVVVIEKIK